MDNREVGCEWVGVVSQVIAVIKKNFKIYITFFF